MMLKQLMKRGSALTLAVVLAACSSKPSEPKKTEPEMKVEIKKADRTESKPAPKPEAPVFEGPGKLLPKTVGAFELTSTPRYFGPDNLYDLINGGAEIYTEFGLKKMVTADYTAKDRTGITITVEIYDMGTPAGAFGRFARFLKGKADLSDVGKGLPEPLVPHGLMGTSNASFWKGHHLINLTLLDESPSATMEGIRKLSAEMLPPFAENVAKTIPGELALPAETAWFPKEQLIPRSQAYDVRKLAGIDGLGPGYSARYQAEDAEYQLFVTGETDEPDAQLDAVKKDEGDAAPKRRMAKAAGKRVVGYATTSETWTPKHAKTAAAAVDALIAALPK